MPVPISNLSATFANSQQTFVGLGLNVSYTAAATGSRLFELKVNNEPKFWIGLNGVPSTNLSSNDSVARTLAQDAYDLAFSLTGVGVAANTFTISTIAGANVAVGTGANNYSNDTFVKLSAPSQSISGNVNFDSSTLFIDSVGNKVSIGRTDGTYALDVVGSINASAVLVNGVASGGLGDVTSATLSGANTAVGAGANAFSAATIAGANTISIAAFERANTPNIYIANSNISAPITIFSSTPKILNFRSDSANTGVDVNIENFVLEAAANVSITAYDIILNNVAIGATNSYVLNNTIINRPYKIFNVYLNQMSLTGSGTMTLSWSGNNGSNFRNIALRTEAITSNDVTSFSTILNANSPSRAFRKRVLSWVSVSDGVSITTFTLHDGGSLALSDSPINWLSVNTQGGVNFDNGYMTIIGFR